MLMGDGFLTANSPLPIIANIRESMKLDVEGLDVANRSNRKRT
jgi:hypothetical protein